MLALFVGVEDNEGVGFFGERGFGRRHADDGCAVRLGEFRRFDELRGFTGARDEKCNVLRAQTRGAQVHHVGVGTRGGVQSRTDEFVLCVVGDGCGAAETKHVHAACAL